MSKIWLLLKAQMLNYFLINEVRKPGNKNRNSAVTVGFGLVILILFLCIYNVLISRTLAQIGKQELIPAYMVAISSFAILLLTLFYANGILFSSRDTDMLSALPVKNSEILSSKLLFIYLINFVLGFVFMVPGGIVWIMTQRQTASAFVLYFLSVFFVPLIPICISALIGVLIVFTSSHFKYRNTFALIFSFMVFGLVGYIGLASVRTGNTVSDLGARLAGQISGIYPPSRLFLTNTYYPMSVGIAAFSMISIIVSFLFVTLVAKKYRLLIFLANATSTHSARKRKLKRQSQFSALYRKEMGRLFSSYMAVLNTGLGVVLLCFFSILLLIMSPRQLGNYTGINNMNGFLSEYSSVIIAAMLSLSCPAASSISLEGKNVWILQSSPVSVKEILQSKIAVNLSLHALGYILAFLAFIVRLNLNELQMISLLLIPIAYSLFTVVLGISLNKAYPNYEWENEMLVIKQSIPVVVTGIVTMMAVAVPVLLHLFLTFPIIPILWITAIVLFIITFILYQTACASPFL